ncbi:hypothetical protein EHR04_15570 [Leptospira levettii]|uniref:Uncharacterized protein n=1 Tax=Leptospira levettii TaxID=2023178 RepID=A0A2N0AZL9_9LEPT|nr:hypothetical protein [Leptospira levettii]PKA27737.1 hypothetical protein CH381_04310 [Leptospira sp. mixed culture ATI2-C-A1]MCG6148174.1 hypothetical protein [Leptospira levettii]MCW7464546.1 hypothetical protein [Leptospira levettii]MCW7473389.1 hypothetical protein [Leptospira levettii]MCW7495387.1 hypothetical protein [Leptospira levettii]
MILNENFASIAHHYDFARRAQAENPFTHQNQVVELQKVVIQTQNRAQTVPETKSGTQGSAAKPKQDKENSVFAYSKEGIIYDRPNLERGSRFDSKA